MERNVLLLYMSPFGKNPNIHTQTNEAAVLELKKHKEGLDCILALCSELVRTSPTVHLPDGKTCTTVEYFRDVFLPSAGIPAERLVVIPVPDSMDDKAQFRAISLLLGKIEAEDTLSIDLSGGMRDTAMLLVTAARCMRDLRGVETRRVIYSELLPDGTSRIHDSSQLYSLFDLITAMDEFFSTGTAQKLKGYLWSEGESDPALHTLLARINQFSDDLALCRVQALNEDLSQIAQALQAPPKESKNLTSLFFHLLNDRFRTEFEGLLASPKNNLPALVSWCTEHGMYQQALTLLCEQMPTYVCRHLFVQPTETGWAYLPFLPPDFDAKGVSLYNGSAPDPQQGRCRWQYAVRCSKFERNARLYGYDPRFRSAGDRPGGPVADRGCGTVLPVCDAVPQPDQPCQ